MASAVLSRRAVLKLRDVPGRARPTVMQALPVVVFRVTMVSPPRGTTLSGACIPPERQDAALPRRKLIHWPSFGAGEPEELSPV